MNHYKIISDKDDYLTQEYRPSALVSPELFKGLTVPIPLSGHPGAFGAARKHDIHTGVDLYVPEGTPVYALNDGVVVDISKFTGPDANPPCPWWNETYSVTIFNPETKIFLLYGEINVVDFPTSPFFIKKGTLLGTVAKVLKKDKGKPMSMLHVEAYTKLKCTMLDNKHMQIIHPYWNHYEQCPDGLLDPTSFII